MKQNQKIKKWKDLIYLYGESKITRIETRALEWNNNRNEFYLYGESKITRIETLKFYKVSEYGIVIYMENQR